MAQKLIEEARQKSIQRAAELEAQKQADAQAKALKNKQIADVINTANTAIDRYGDKLGKSPYIQTIFDSPNYRIRASNLLNEYDLTIGKTLVIKDRYSKAILLKYNQYNSGKNQLISENISSECVEHFARLSSRFEQAKRVKDFYKLTNDFFWKLGKIQKLEGSPNRWVAEGNKYKLVLDKQGFKITAKDGRGEIFNYPKGVRNPELMVTTCKFTESDINNFKQASKEVNNMLLKIRQQEEQQRRQRRSRSRGFEL